MSKTRTEPVHEVDERPKRVKRPSPWRNYYGEFGHQVPPWCAFMYVVGLPIMYGSFFAFVLGLIAWHFIIKGWFT